MTVGSVPNVPGGEVSDGGMVAILAGEELELAPALVEVVFDELEDRVDVGLAEVELHAARVKQSATVPVNTQALLNLFLSSFDIRKRPFLSL